MCFNGGCESTAGNAEREVEGFFDILKKWRVTCGGWRAATGSLRTASMGDGLMDCWDGRGWSKVRVGQAILKMDVEAA